MGNPTDIFFCWLCLVRRKLIVNASSEVNLWVGKVMWTVILESGNKGKIVADGRLFILSYTGIMWLKIGCSLIVQRYQ